MSPLARFSFLFALVLALAACDTSEPDTGIDAPVLVANQGAFGNDASGGITTYDPATGLAEDLSAPGGLVQAVVARDGKLYLLLNFSDSFSTGRGRLDVIDLETGETTQQINVGTPRGIAFVGETAFVTDLYGGAVTPVNLASGAPGTPIPVGDNPEGIVALGRTLYVANSGFGSGSTLSVIDVDTRQVTDTVDLSGTPIECRGPNELAVGAGDRILIVCTGQSDFSTGVVTTGGAFLTLDTATMSVFSPVGLGDRLFGGAALGQDLAYDAAADQLFLVSSASGADDRVYRIQAASTNPSTTFVDIGGADIGGIGVVGGQVYLGRLDATNPFSDDGFVSIHTLDGTETARFDAGVIPAGFAFSDQ